MSRQFSGRSSTTTSSSRPAAILPARRGHDEQRGILEAVRAQPSLALHLHDVTGRARPAGEKHHLPPARARRLGQALDDAGLGLVERLPEVVDALDRVPELPFLTPREAQRRGAGLGGIGAVGAVGVNRGRRHALIGLLREVEAGKQPRGLSHQRAIEVGDDAVEIEAETEGHRDGAPKLVTTRRSRRRERNRHEARGCRRSEWSAPGECV